MSHDILSTFATPAKYAEECSRDILTAELGMTAFQELVHGVLVLLEPDNHALSLSLPLSSADTSNVQSLFPFPCLRFSRELNIQPLDAPI
jgi:hypothetical protein